VPVKEHLYCEEDVWSVSVASNANEIKQSVLAIKTYLDKGVCSNVMQLDTEWNPFATDTKNFKLTESGVHLISICVDFFNPLPPKAFLLRVQCPRSPTLTAELKNLLECDKITWAGRSIISVDARRLSKGYGVTLREDKLLDVATFAEGVGMGKKTDSLTTLYNIATGKTWTKAKGTRISRWDARSLTKKQITYAAMDVFASREIFQIADRKKTERADAVYAKRLNREQQQGGHELRQRLRAGVSTRSGRRRREVFSKVV
jgi:hypothetical protein